MRVLGVDPAQQRQREGIEGADHGFSSGIACEPSARDVKILHAAHRAEIEFAIEMRKQLVIARALPAQRAAERIDIDFDQEQAGLSGEEFSRGLGDLGCGREMDIAVARIVSAAAVDALPLGLAPD